MNILFGETLVGVVFLVWWALGSPPLVFIFVLAALVAGYYVWRAGICTFYSTNCGQSVCADADSNEPCRIVSPYVHIIPSCLTDAPVSE